MALWLLLVSSLPHTPVDPTKAGHTNHETSRARAPQRVVRLHARLAAAIAMAAIWGLRGGADVSALSCVERPEDEIAAREAINGEHPAWAMGYMVAVVESISREGDLSVAVRPTHVFSGEYPERLTLRARPDGPPDPAIFRPGRSYFLSLGHAAAASGELLIQPCAPNFEVSPEQVERLVDVAPHVEIREAPSPIPDPVLPVWPFVAAITIILAVVGAGFIIVRQR